MNRKKFLRTFLSYVPEDSEHADSLRKVLSHREDVSLVTRDVRESKSWQAKFAEELRSCDLFVVVLPQKSPQSDWLMHQLGFAFGACRAVVAVKTERSAEIPVRLHGVFWKRIEDAVKPAEWDQMLPKFGAGYFGFLSRSPVESSVEA
jgi:hypothetical protein